MTAKSPLFRSLIALSCLVATCATRGQASIETYGVGKRRDYLQNSTANPTSHAIMSNPGGPFLFSAYLSGSNLNLLSTTRVTLPNSTQYNLTGDASSRGLDLAYTSQSALDSAFPNGSYTITAGASLYPVSLGATNAYPAEIPMITSGTWDSQGRLVVNAVSGATLSFSGFPSYASGAGGIVSFDLYAVSGGTATMDLATASSVSLTGYGTDPVLGSYAIPGNLLQPNQTYYAELTYTRITSLEVSSYPIFGIGLFSTTTGFTITTTVPDTAPVITTQPQSQTVTVGTNVTLTVAASGNPAPAYQWRKNGNNILGATGASYNLPAVQLTDGGSYTVVVSNSVGSVISDGATLTVNLPAVAPTILAQPVSQTILAGATASFSVSADGDAPLSYRWRKDGVNLADGNGLTGSGTATLTVANAQVGASGSYTVVVSNSGGSITSAPATLLVSAQPGVVAVAAGAYHSLFIRADGTLWGMGISQYGELGDGNYYHNSPVFIASGVVAAAAGYNHSVFLKADGTVWTMGRNTEGQLGDGTTTSRAFPVQVGSDVVAIAAGERYSLLLQSNGTMWGMGAGGYGELGLGMADLALSPRPARTGVVGIAGGRDFSLFVRGDGGLWGCGSNYSGQLGDGTNLNLRASPIQIAGGVSTASAGYMSSCFVKSDGTLWSMGSNAYGQLGDGTMVDRAQPVAIAAGVVQADAGESHGLFLKTDRTLWSMGSNLDGQLGDGTIAAHYSPVQVSTGVAAISAGYWHSLFCKTDGSLWGMGSNNVGQLGAGLIADNPTPLLIAGGPVAPPQAPAFMTAGLDSNFPYWLRLTWGHSLGATAYEVWRSTVNTPAGASRIATVSIPLYYDLSAVSGVTYYYWTKAGNFSGLSGFSPLASLTVPKPRQVAADFNTDGNPDLIWSNSITGERALWLMNGTNFLAASTLGIFPLEWTVAATGDFNADGKPDLVWSNSLTGERALWLMNGTNLLAVSTLGTFPLEWTVAATGDFNGDGKPDLVWSNSLTGERALWLMDGTTRIGVSTLGVFPLEWTVAATGDFNFDGKPDLVWANSLTGERALWLMDGTIRIGVSTLGIFPLEWTVAGTADFNGDGKPDIIWSNSVTGERALWLMDGTNFLGASTLGVFPLEWTAKN